VGAVDRPIRARGVSLWLRAASFSLPFSSFHFAVCGCVNENRKWEAREYEKEYADSSLITSYSFFLIGIHGRFYPCNLFCSCYGNS
jgi:hypothetical protein